jgi:hypothetical protein
MLEKYQTEKAIKESKKQAKKEMIVEKKEVLTTGFDHGFGKFDTYVPGRDAGNA